jgi:RecJ-like exonuclease
MLQDYMKDPEFASAFFIEEISLAVTEAVCAVLNSYGFKQGTYQQPNQKGKAVTMHCEMCGDKLLLDEIDYCDKGLCFSCCGEIHMDEVDCRKETCFYSDTCPGHPDQTL